MSFTEARAYDLNRVFLNTDEFGETIAYRSDAQPEISSIGYWGNPEPVDAGQGVIIEIREVYIARASLADAFGTILTPTPDAALIRYPGTLDGEEEWSITADGVNRDGALWRLRVMRPVPR